MIDAMSVLGLTEIEAVKATVDTREVGTINPNVRAEAAINPDSELLPVARMAGITSAVVTPLGGTIAGTSALVHLDGWTWEDMTVKAPAALVVVWPARTSRPVQPDPEAGEKANKEREERLEELRNAFADARAYLKARQAMGKPGVPRHPSEPKWESMIQALQGTIPVLVRVTWAEDIEDAVAWGDKEGLRLILAGAEEAWKVAGLLKSKDIPVILDKVFDEPKRRFEPYDSHFRRAALLHEAGVRFAFATDSGADARNLPYNAAMAVAHGLPEEAAMKAITASPAAIYGVGDLVGTIAPGLIADIMVTDGSPLEIRTQVKYVFIAGREIPLTSRHTRLYEKYRNRPRPATSATGGGTAGSVGSTKP
jgi:imidazolonepropionase-like amidohydrolase